MNSKEYLELGKTPYWLPIVIFGPLGIGMIALTLNFSSISYSHAIWIVISGLFSWTLIEYLLHRFSFHILTEKEPWKFMSSGFHRLHHEIPNAPDYVVAPIIMAAPLYLVFLLIVWAITQSLSVTLLWGAGLAFGYLTYEWIHYFSHHGRPKTRLGRYLKQYHSIHHFKDSDNYFGVSSPFWDIVFRTKPAYDPTKETSVLPIKSREKILT